MIAEVGTDNLDVTHELGFLGEGNDDIKIINVAAIVHIAEIKSNKAIKLIEEDIREELAGKIADYDTMTRFAVEEAFVGRKGCPIFTGSTNDNIAHGVVVDDLVPEELDGLVELVAVARAAGNLVFGEIMGR